MRTGAIMSTAKRTNNSVKSKPSNQRKSQKLNSPQSGLPLSEMDHYHFDFWDDIKRSLKLIDSDIINENVGMSKIEVDLKDKLNLNKSSKTSYFIDPSNSIKIYWDIFIGVLILYSIVTIPFYYSFSLNSNEYVDYTIDFFFFVDILLTFNTALLDKNSNILILDHKIIAREYLKFWFWIDLSSTVPLDSILNLLLSSLNGSSVASLSRLMRIIRLLRLFKIIRVLKLNKLYESLEEANFNPSLIDAQALLLKILFVSHLVACFWYLMSTLSNDDTSWVKKFSFENASIADKYVAAFYWTTTTLLSIGYGDIYAVNNNERIYAIFAQIFGGIIFGAVIAQVTQIFDKMNPTAKAYKDRMAELSAYLEEKPLPVTLKISTKDAYSYYLRHKSCFSEMSILSDLPDNLRDILVKDVYGNEINKIYIFQQLEKSLVVSLVMKLKPFKVSTGEVLAGRGNVVSEIVFILRGVVQFTLGSGSDMVILGFDTSGGYFGIFGYYKRTLSMGQHEALSTCELMSLDVRHLDESLNEYPDESQPLLQDIDTRYHNFLISKNSVDIHLSNGTLRKKDLLIDGYVTSDDHLPDKVLGILKNDIRHHNNTIRDFIDKSQGRLQSVMRIEPSSNSTRNTEAVTTNKEAVEAAVAAAVSGTNNNRSTNEPESNSNLEHLHIIENHLIHPKGTKKRYWDIAVGLLIVFSVLSAPYQMAFILNESPIMVWVAITIDVFFIIDMFVTSRTCFFDTKDEILITNIHLIRRRYLKRWFWIDLFSSFPIDVVWKAIDHQSTTAAYANNIMKVMRLTRLLKMIRLLKIDRLLILLEENLGLSSRVFQLIKLLAQVLLIGHFVACLWWFLGDNMSSDAWFDNYSYRDKPTMDRYVLSLYWTFTTLSTVGYGDIVAGNSAERVVNILIELIGASLFGYVVANVSSIVGNIDATADKINSHVEEVKHYLLEKQSLQSTSKMIIKHSKQQFTYMSVFDEVSILQSLPESIIKKIVSIRHKNTIRQICIFRFIHNRSIILHIFRRMMPHFFDAGHFIVKYGDEAKTIHFLVVGQAIELAPVFTNVTNKFGSNRNSNNNSRAFSPRRSTRRTSFEKFLEEEKMSRNNPTEFKVTGEIKTGDFFGYQSMITRTLNKTSIKATTSCTTYSLSLHEISLLSEDAKAIGFSLRNAFAKCIHNQTKEIEKRKKCNLRLYFMLYLKKKYLDSIRSGTSNFNKKKTKISMLASVSKSKLTSTWNMSNLSNNSVRVRRSDKIGKTLISRSQNSTRVFAEEEQKSTGTAEDDKSFEELEDRNSSKSNSVLVSRSNSKNIVSILPGKSQLLLASPRNNRIVSAPAPLATTTTTTTNYNNIKKLTKSPSNWDIVRMAVLRPSGDTSPDIRVLELKDLWLNIVKQRIKEDATISSDGKPQAMKLKKQASSINISAIIRVAKKLRAFTIEESKFAYDSDDDNFQKKPLFRIKRELKSLARRNSAPSFSMRENERKVSWMKNNSISALNKNKNFVLLKRSQSFTSIDFFTNKNKIDYEKNLFVVVD